MFSVLLSSAISFCSFSVSVNFFIFSIIVLFTTLVGLIVIDVKFVASSSTIINLFVVGVLVALAIVFLLLLKLLCVIF
jgi:hypothetical protein